MAEEGGIRHTAIMPRPRPPFPHHAEEPPCHKEEKTLPPPPRSHTHAVKPPPTRQRKKEEGVSVALKDGKKMDLIFFKKNLYYGI